MTYMTRGETANLLRELRELSEAVGDRIWDKAEGPTDAALAGVLTRAYYALLSTLPRDDRAAAPAPAEAAHAR